MTPRRYGAGPGARTRVAWAPARLPSVWVHPSCSPTVACWSERGRASRLAPVAAAARVGLREASARWAGVAGRGAVGAPARWGRPWGAPPTAGALGAGTALPCTARTVRLGGAWAATAPRSGTPPTECV